MVLDHHLRLRVRRGDGCAPAPRGVFAAQRQDLMKNVAWFLLGLLISLMLLSACISNPQEVKKTKMRRAISMQTLSREIIRIRERRNRRDFDYGA